MIPWGSTEDGGSYLWVSDGADADRWTVFVEWDLSSASYPLGMEDFLLSGLRGQLDAFALGDGFPSTLPAYVDPVISMTRAYVQFDPPLEWGDPEVATLCQSFGMPVRTDGNSLIVRPSRWGLTWHAGSLTIDMRPEEIHLPKAQVAALLAALGVRVTSAAPDSWHDLVE